MAYFPFSLHLGKLLLNLVDHTEVVRDLTFAPDGSLILVSASRDKTLRVWDLKDDGMSFFTGYEKISFLTLLLKDNWVYPRRLTYKWHMISFLFYT